jgi:hypothetical protein
MDAYDWYKAVGKERAKAVAEKCGMHFEYFVHICTCFRRPRVDRMLKMIDASADDCRGRPEKDWAIMTISDLAKTDKQMKKRRAEILTLNARKRGGPK